YDGESGRLAYEIARSNNPKLKLFVSEWNTPSAEWRAGLDAGEILNTMERDGAVGMASLAQVLCHISADFPADALIRFDQMYRDHFAPDLLEVKGELGGIDAAATRTAD